jgi:RNA polymerase sigma-70 factor (ECF subfamily)
MLDSAILRACPGFSVGSQSGDVVELASTPEDSIRQLLAARDGDHEAGRRLIERHGASMLRTAWSVLGRYGGTEADDVVQEALVAALTTSALPSGDVGAWLRSIAVRKALDWLRQSKRRAEQPFPEPGQGAPEPRAGGNPEAGIDRLTLRKGLAQLSALDRAVLVLADLEGRSMAEVAQIVGSTRVAVKLRASRARRKLARFLAPVPAATHPADRGIDGEGSQ